VANHKFPIIIEEYKKIKNPFKSNKVHEIYLYSYQKRKQLSEVENPNRLKSSIFYKKVLVFIVSIIVK